MEEKRRKKEEKKEKYTKVRKIMYKICKKVDKLKRKEYT